MTALDLSYYILRNSGNFNTTGITPLKMQKLIYYVYVWSIVADKKIIDDTFVKWQYGPVNSSVYNYYKKFGTSEIELNGEKEVELSTDEKSFINIIVSNYIKYNAVTLSALTHKDVPWQKAIPESPIDPIEIKQFYSKLNFAKIFL